MQMLRQQLTRRHDRRGEERLAEGAQPAADTGKMGTSQNTRCATVVEARQRKMARRVG